MTEYPDVVRRLDIFKRDTQVNPELHAYRSMDGKPYGGVV